MEWKRYRKNFHIEARPYEDGEDLGDISVSIIDREGGSPKVGDMIARDPTNPNDLWLVSYDFFQRNYVEDQ